MDLSHSLSLSLSLNEAAYGELSIVRGEEDPLKVWMMPTCEKK